MAFCFNLTFFHEDSSSSLLYLWVICISLPVSLGFYKNFPYWVDGTFFFNGFINIYFTYHIIFLFKIYCSMIFSLFTGLCKHYHSLILEYFLHPQKNHVHISSHSLFLLLSALPQSQENMNLLSKCMNCMF